MNDSVVQFWVALHSIVNPIGRWVLAPLGVLPELLGATAVAIVTGIALLIAFKFTSDQKAIKATRAAIKAEMLALTLFRDSVTVNLRSQGRIVWGAAKLMALALIPIAVMLLPVMVLLGQLSLWWEARPFRVGEEAVLTVKLRGNDTIPWPNIQLHESPGFEIVQGPYQIRSKRQICWKIQCRQPGYQSITISADGENVSKELAIGDRPMRVSQQRPDQEWTLVLVNPAEPPTPQSSAVQWIQLQYPSNPATFTGKSTWIWYWFAMSTLTAFCLRGPLNVNF